MQWYFWQFWVSALPTKSWILLRLEFILEENAILLKKKKMSEGFYLSREN